MSTTGVGFSGTTLKPVDISSGSVVSVSKFGAVGNGSTNDTAAIQAAFNYIEKNGGTLNFDAGRTYVVSGSLRINNADNFEIDGNGATIKMANGAPVKSGMQILQINNSNHFSVTDLTVDGNRAHRDPAEVSAHNIAIRGSEDFSFVRVASHNAVTDGFYVNASDKADASTFSQDGLFLDCSADNGFRQGMSIINGDNIQVIGGAYTNTHGTAPAAGIDVEPNNGSAEPGGHNILIRGVRLTGNDGFGVQLSKKGDPANITIEDSYLADNSRGAIKLGTAETLIHKNTFENFDHSDRGLIDLPAAQTNSHNVITDNVFSNINIADAVIFAHRYSGEDNQVYGNKFYNIDGPLLDINTDGTTAWDNTELSGSAPAPEPEPSPDPQPTPDPEPTPDPGEDDGVNDGGTAQHLEGTDGADRLDGGSGNDSIQGRPGDDQLYGHDGNDFLSGQAGDDVLRGQAGDDLLYGGTGADTLNGARGSDTLYGGRGDDILYGGADADQFVLTEPNSGNDVINDFDMAEGDKLVLTAEQVSAVQVSANASGDAVVDLGGGNHVTLLGLRPDHIDASSFDVA